MVTVDVNPAPVLSGTIPFTVELAFSVEDDNPNAATGTVIGALSWGDGTSSSVSCVRSGDFLVQHVYAIQGLYLLELLVHDLAYPTNNKTRKVFQVQVHPSHILPDVPDPVLIGPSIPLDDGNTELNEWELDLSTDEKLLASDLKVLLTTQKGERLMDPNYGTNLKLIVFDPIYGAPAAIEGEIRKAVSTYEPRVILQNVSTASSGQQVVVKVDFKPNLTARSLTIFLPFTA